MMSDENFQRLEESIRLTFIVTQPVPCTDWDAFAVEAHRNRETLKNAPHGALCKRGLKNLYDPGGKCTCWKKDI